jgi:hypothetical protein
MAMARFIADESGLGYCFVIGAIACGVGYLMAHARWPVLRPGLLESQLFAVTVYVAMLAAALPVHVALVGAGAPLSTTVLLAILLPVKLLAAIVAAAYLYPWWVTRRAAHEAAVCDPTPDEEEAQATTTPPWFEHRGRRCGEAVWSRMWRLTRSRGASAGEVVGVAAASRFGCRTGKVRAAKER